MSHIAAGAPRADHHSEPPMPVQPVQPARPLATRFALPAVLVLGGMALGTLAPDALRPSVAVAQSSSSEPPFNAAEQRKTMIAQLTQINERLGRLESKLDKPLSVKVLEMPAQKDAGK